MAKYNPFSGAHVVEEVYLVLPELFVPVVKIAPQILEIYLGKQALYLVDLQGMHLFEKDRGSCP